MPGRWPYLSSAPYVPFGTMGPASSRLRALSWATKRTRTCHRAGRTTGRQPVRPGGHR
jgi:hypothetical protein